MFINFDPSGRQPKGILTQVLTAILGAVLLGAAFMFSLVFFAVLAVAGVILWAYFWWKTRAIRSQLRKQMNAQMSGQNFEAPPSAPESNGDVIEGEAVRVAESDRQVDHDANSGLR
jgi:membrane protein implicated in regulation of membrane protease activity